MKRSDRNAVAESTAADLKSNGKNNGHSATEVAPADLVAILGCLQTMRDGDFSVRLPGSWVGLSGKIADTFNEIAAVNHQIAQELKRVGQVVGKEGKTRERTRLRVGPPRT